MHIEVVIRSAVNLRHVQCVTNSVVYCIADLQRVNPIMSGMSSLLVNPKMWLLYVHPITCGAMID